MQVGDKIVYPMHGAGEITKIEKKEFDGELLLYCTVEMNIKELVLQFPVNRVEALGIRKLMSESDILNSLKKSSKKEHINEGNWNKRFQASLEQLKTGKIKDVTNVIIYFKEIEIEKGLSSGERQLYHNAISVLTSELMYIKDYDKEKAEKYLLKKIEEVM